jgi:DNA-binding beta-propeller fold protein YncE
MNRLGTVATLAFVLVAGACSAPGKPDPSPAEGRHPQAGTSDRVVLGDGRGSGPTPYSVVDGDTGTVLARLPAGVPAADWHVLFATSSSGTSTVVRAIDPNDGSVQREISVAGAWQLPSIGLARTPGGLSGDGRTLVLEELRSTGSLSTRFTIVATEGRRAPRLITLPGRFSFDALSPDGTFLYVIEHLTATDYLVRQVDVTTGQLAAGAILDKRNVDERMAGYPATQLWGPGGWVYTVYRGTDGDFIHALDTLRGFAVCIDLPGTEQTDEATAGYWGLALDATGRALYAANGDLGRVSEVSLDGFSVTRTRTVPTAGRSVILAKLGGHDRAPAGGQVAASADGSTLYVLGERGVASIRVSDLASTGRLGTDRIYLGLALSAGGSLYVVDDTGAVSRVGTTLGSASTALDGGGYSQILAVMPTR